MERYIFEFCNKIKVAGGTAYFVGGTVRDRIMGRDLKDYDIEVYGLLKEDLLKTLSSYKLELVGESFQVFKVYIGGQCLDVSLPRKEFKINGDNSHRSFITDADPFLSHKEACRRRDFTMNAILCDPLTGEYVDPFNGIRDIQTNTISIVDPKTFVEDPLRVLRGLQFVSRLGFSIDLKTRQVMKSISLEGLTKERILEEIMKLVSGDYIELAYLCGKDMGIWNKIFYPLLPNGGEKNFCLDFSSKDTNIIKAVKFLILFGEYCRDLHDLHYLMDKINLHTVNGFNFRKYVEFLFIAGRTVNMADFRHMAFTNSLSGVVDYLSGIGKSVLAENVRFFADKENLMYSALSPLLNGEDMLELGYNQGKEIGNILNLSKLMQASRIHTTKNDALGWLKTYENSKG